MAAIGGWAQIGADRSSRIPSEFADRGAADGAVRVILPVDDEREDADRRRLASKPVLRAYAEEDAIDDDIEHPPG